MNECGGRGGGWEIRGKKEDITGKERSKRVGKENGGVLPSEGHEEKGLWMPVEKKIQISPRGQGETD